MAFMAVEVCICQGPIYVMDCILVMKASWCQYILFLFSYCSPPTKIFRSSKDHLC